MNKRGSSKGIIRMIIVILLIILGAFVAFFVLPKLYQNEEATVNIVMLKQDVSAGTRIEESMLATVPIGSYGLPGSVIKNPADIIGKYAVQNISYKDLLYAEKFSDQDPLKTGAADPGIELKDNEMLLTLALSSTAAGAAGNILPGDKVNAAVYQKEKTTSGTGTNFGSTVNMGENTDQQDERVDHVIFPESLQGLTVYRVLTSQLVPVDPTAQVTGSGSNDRIPVYITLICTQEQADLLLDYSYTDTLHFVEVD